MLASYISGADHTRSTLTAYGVMSVVFTVRKLEIIIIMITTTTTTTTIIIIIITKI